MVLALVLALAGCKEEESAAPEVHIPSKQERALEAFGTNLLQLHSSELSSFETPRRTLRKPLAYLTVFTTSDSSLHIEAMETYDEAVIARNAQASARWREMYCTAGLYELMREHEIAVAAGQLAASDGTWHSRANCLAAGVKLVPSED